MNGSVIGWMEDRQSGIQFHVLLLRRNVALRCIPEQAKQKNREQDRNVRHVTSASSTHLLSPPLPLRLVFICVLRHHYLRPSGRESSVHPCWQPIQRNEDPGAVPIRTFRLLCPSTLLPPVGGTYRTPRSLHPDRERWAALDQGTDRPGTAVSSGAGCDVRDRVGRRHPGRIPLQHGQGRRPRGRS